MSWTYSSDEEHDDGLDCVYMDNIDDGDGDQDVGSIARLGNIGHSLTPDTMSYRHLGPGSCVLSRYIGEYRTGSPIETGFLGDQRYVIPLHLSSIVPGHSNLRVAVCDTGSTRVGELVQVVSHISGSICPSHITGTTAMCNLIDIVNTSMQTNDILPECFDIAVTKHIDGVNQVDRAPITLNHQDMVARLKGLSLQYIGSRGLYHVPLGCPDKRYKVPCGLGSTLVSNNVVLMYPNVPQYLVSEEHRRPTEDQLGFLCCVSSSTSASLKGLVRYAVCDIVCRCYNCGVGDEMVELSHMLKSRECDCASGESHVQLMVAGVAVLICGECMSVIQSIVDKYSALTPHSITLHQVPSTSNGHVTVLSFCTGTMMRLSSERGVWVDNMSSTEFDGTYRQCVSSPVSLIPFIEYINPTRAGLMSVYLNQAISLPCNKYHGGITLVPLYLQKPYIMSDHCHYGDNDTLDAIPGLNLLVVFMNMELTYEDGMVMSRSAARRFGYEATISVYLNPAVNTIPLLGDVVEPFSTVWWQNHFDGKVVHRAAGPHGTVRLSIQCSCHPVNGDKFTTLHGQKGVVTIFDDHEMPMVNGTPAEIVIGSSSVIKRETASQLLEAACGMYVHKYLDHTCTYYTDTVLSSYATEFNITTDAITSIVARYEDSVTIRGVIPRRLVTSIRGGTVIAKSVRCNYGYIRVVQSCFLASLRMSCTTSHSGAHSLSINTRSNHGGSRSLGEMECMQLMASGMTGCLEEFTNRSDMCVVGVCRRCRLLSIVCVCAQSSDDDLGVDIIRLPYRTIKAIVSSKVGLNANVRLTIS
jgi:RNA polymerase Rpb2, domain 6